MNRSPHHLHIKELNVLGLPGGSGSGDEDGSPRKSKKKSRSPIEKPFSSSEEEKLVKTSDDEKSEDYGTFGAKSSTPKKRPVVKPSRSLKHPARLTKQPTEMEGSAVHGLDVFSNEEKVSRLRNLSPPILVRTRKFPPGSPPQTGAEKSPEKSKDNPSTGAIPKKTAGKLRPSDKSTSKHQSSKTASPPRTESLPAKESEVETKSATPEKPEKSKVSKLKSTYRSPRKAIQKCLSLLTSPPKKDPKEQESRSPRTRSQTRKAKVEELKQDKLETKTQTKQTLQPKTKQKPSKKVRERSSSNSAQADRMSLISSVDKSSESDSSPQCSPRKSRKRRDPLLPSLFGKPIEDVCSIVSKPDSDSCIDMELSPSSDVENSSTGDKLLLPLAKLSTDPDEDRDSNESTKEKSESSSDE